MIITYETKRSSGAYEIYNYSFDNENVEIKTTSNERINIIGIVKFEVFTNDFKSIKKYENTRGY